MRYDQPDRTPVAARYDQVCDTTMCTKLGRPGGPTIATIEHLMAALAACEIDNALVELGGPELPIMDGSAQPFVFLIECAGVVEQDRPRRWIEILKPVTVCGQDKSARLEPADRFEIDCAIHFDHPLIDHQSLQFAFTPDGFKAEIARARTFGFAERIEELWSRGLGLGGSLKSTVVVSHDQVLSDGGLRFPDEFVRHKVLDTHRRSLHRGRADHRPLHRPPRRPYLAQPAAAGAVRRPARVARGRPSAAWSSR